MMLMFRMDDFHRYYQVAAFSRRPNLQLHVGCLVDGWDNIGGS